MSCAAAWIAASLVGPVLSQAAQPTAQQVIDRIQKNVGVPWTTPTVDTIKAGAPDTPVTGIAVTMMATYDVLERSAAAGKNLVITHEPTFYNHLDKTDTLQSQNDAVLAQKEAFIRDHHLVVWRFHDHWHKHRPDGILLGMTKALGWEKYENPNEPRLFTLPETTLNELSEHAKSKLDIHIVRVVGNPEMKVTQVAMIPGAAGSAAQIKLLERQDVQALVIGETPEWETVEYVADATSEHRQKGLVIVGHIPSEQAGMDECARWLKTFIKDVPIEFIPAREPFWAPQR